MSAITAKTLPTAPPHVPADPHQTSTPGQLVDALNCVFGKQTTGRAVHAKGVVLQGRFVPSPTAAALSVAPHLQSTPVPIIVRFSDFAGVLTVADTDGLANPRGMAIKFQLPDGTDSDLVCHSFNGFPVSNSDDFRQLLLAIAASGPDAAKPTALERFFETHPTAKTFLTTQKGPPVSYATLSYFGVNSFKFTNAQGLVSYGRYQILPEAGEHLLNSEAVKATAHDYLIEEIGKRVAQAPVRFAFVVQLAAAGDKIDDPSIVWPDDRKTIELGEIVIDIPVADNVAAQRSLLFMPNALPVGIEPADPMLIARAESYPISFSRRHQCPVGT